MGVVIFALANCGHVLKVVVEVDGVVLSEHKCAVLSLIFDFFVIVSIRFLLTIHISDDVFDLDDWRQGIGNMVKFFVVDETQLDQLQLVMFEFDHEVA